MLHAYSVHVFPICLCLVLASCWVGAAGWLAFFLIGGAASVVWGGRTSTVWGDGRRADSLGRRMMGPLFNVICLEGDGYSYG